MFEIHVKGDFEAAHRVVNYPGKCDRLHGHSWTVEVYAEGEQPDELGMLVDFKKVKRELNAILDRLDHQYINDIPPFSDGLNPTAENLAKYIYQCMEVCGLFSSGAVRLTSVRVWESPHACAVYRKG